jgi:hypothetical protein
MGAAIPSREAAKATALAAAEAQLRARLAVMQATAAAAVDGADARRREVVVSNIGPAVTADAICALLNASLGAAFDEATTGGPPVLRVVAAPERAAATVELRAEAMAAAAATLSDQVELLGSTLRISRPATVDPAKATAASASAAAALAKLLAGDPAGARDELASIGVKLAAFENADLGLPPPPPPAPAPAPPPAAPRPPRPKPTPCLRVDGVLTPAVMADADALTTALTGLAAECAKFGDVCRVETGAPADGGDGGAPVFVVFAAAPLAAVARMAVNGKPFGGGVAAASFCAPEDVPAEVAAE